MNGYEIYNKASIRLGYKTSEQTEVLDNGLSLKALEFINQIALDLRLPVVSDLSKEINCSPDSLDALCCGTAMLLSMSMADTNKNVIFTALYNAKRATILSKIETVDDILPIAEG